MTINECEKVLSSIKNDKLNIRHKSTGYGIVEIAEWLINELKAADVQPLSVVAEHIKKRLYETAFNTTEEKARNAIADMAGRIDFWIDELKGGDKE